MMLRVASSRAGAPEMDLFLDKDENLIGRIDAEAGIFPDVDLSRYDPDSYVSRRHCVLRRKGSRFFLEALQSTNATLLNGYPLTPGRPVAIRSGAELLLADLGIRFLVKPCLSREAA